MKNLIKNFGPSSSDASNVDAMVIGSDSSSFSIASFFSVYFVDSFTDVISNPLTNILNERSSIYSKFRLLLGIFVT